MNNKEINIKFSVFPFCQFSSEYFGLKPKEQERESLPQYTQPKTTNIQSLEISFCGENYTVPQTTSGLFTTQSF